MKIKELKIGLKALQRNLQKIKETRLFLSKFAGKEEVKNTERTGTMQIIIIQSTNLLKKYNDKKFISELEKITSIDEHNSIDLIDCTFIMLEEHLHVLIDLIEEEIKPKLTTKEIKNLSGFRENLTKLEEQGARKSIIRNIKESIEELEEGHLLACGMISARTTLYMFEKIKANGISEENKVKRLEEVGAIDKGEISKQTSKSFLDAVKSARNFILHDKEYFPDYSESSNYLSSTIKMAKIYLKYLELIGNRDEI